MSNTAYIHQGDTIHAELGPIIVESELKPSFYEVKILPGDRPKVYLINKTPPELPDRLYGDVCKFTNRSLETFFGLKRNQGVLLTGSPGTGKTIQAKHLAHACVSNGVPVLQVAAPIPGTLLDGFLTRVNQPVCVLVDEFEKVYHLEEDLHSLLTLMDGLGSSTSSVMWVFTSNDAKPSEFLDGRPGRVRYHKMFDLMSDELVREIIEDRLKDTPAALVEETITAVRFLEGITVDGLVSLTDEVKLHKQSPNQFMDILNVVPVLPTYTTSMVGYYIEFHHAWLDTEEYNRFMREVGLSADGGVDEEVYDLTKEQENAFKQLPKEKLVKFYKVEITGSDVKVRPDVKGNLSVGFYMTGYTGDQRAGGHYSVIGPVSQCVKKTADGNLILTDTKGRKILATKSNFGSSKNWAPYASAGGD